MIKKVLPVAIAVCVISFSSCKPKNNFKTKNGFEYMIVKDEKGKTASPGDILKMNITIRDVTYDKNGKATRDSLLISSRAQNHGEPVEMQLQPSGNKGDWMSCLTLFSAGDSGIFRISVDTLRKSLPANQPLPPYLVPGSMVVYEVSMVSVKSLDDYKKEKEAKSAEQLKTDDKALQDYFTKNNLHPEKTASGLYYTITKEGSGNPAQKGQSVSVNYTGKVLDGVTFDSNLDTNFHHKEPFTLTLGQRQVIPGWDEGLALLKKGSKATLYIPSTLAYGPQSPSPKIGPNSILVFDVEILDIKDAAKSDKNNTSANLIKQKK